MPPGDYFKKILDIIFSAPSHIATLRALKDSREGLSGRAVARMGDLNHQSCAVAIRNLEALGVLEKQGTGHTQLVRLNLSSHIVKELLLPLFEKEQSYPQMIYQDLITTLKGRVKIATVFGSVSRQENHADSDLDILLTSENKDDLLDFLSEYGHKFRKKFGIKLSALVLTPSELKARFKQSDPLVINILQDGVDLLPQTLQGSLKWRQNRKNVSPSRVKNTSITQK